MYFIDESSPEYKYSLILRNNLDILKDICNCIALILSIFSHRNYGVPVDLSNAVLMKNKSSVYGLIQFHIHAAAHQTGVAGFARACK